MSVTRATTFWTVTRGRQILGLLFLRLPIVLREPNDNFWLVMLGCGGPKPPTARIAARFTVVAPAL